MSRARAFQLALAFCVVFLLLGLGWAVQRGLRRAPERVIVTVGDVQAVHNDVRVGGRDVRGSARLRDGDELETGPDGRARLRLDDGAIAVVDSSTRLSLRGTRLTLAAGRLFVQGGANARTEVALGAASTTVSSSAAAFERNASGVSKVYCAQGDLVITAPRRQQLRVASGETARFSVGSAEVAPEKAFEDWTGGLAVPWSSATAGQSVLGEVRGRVSPNDAGLPLVIRAQEVEVEDRAIEFRAGQQELCRQQLVLRRQHVQDNRKVIRQRGLGLFEGFVGGRDLVFELLHAPLGGDRIKVVSAFLHVGDGLQPVVLQGGTAHHGGRHGESEAASGGGHHHQCCVLELAHQAWPHALFVEPRLQGDAHAHILGGKERGCAME